MGQQQITIPGGNKKGKPINSAEVEDGDIRYWLQRITGDLEQNPGKKFADRDREWCVAARAELERRKAGGTKAPSAGQSIQRAPAQQQGLELAGDNPAAVNQWFLTNADRFHLIAPSTVVQNLPEGCEIAISIIALDPNPDNGDVYRTDSGKLAPTAPALAKISQAAGVSWDTNNCGPVGDRSDPRYCEYKAVGGWKLLDGTFITDSAHRAVDLRDGSDEIANMSDKQIAQQRTKVIPNAETKAKNRLIRRLGLKPGYTAEELVKPFAVARLMWTGRTNDPQLKQAFALMKAQQMTAGSAALFGPAPAQPRHTIAHMMPPPQAVQFAAQPAPAPVALPDFDDYDTSGGFLTSGDPAELTAGQGGATSTPLPQDRQQSLPNTEAGGKY